MLRMTKSHMIQQDRLSANRAKGTLGLLQPEAGFAVDRKPHCRVFWGESRCHNRIQMANAVKSSIVCTDHGRGLLLARLDHAQDLSWVGGALGFVQSDLPAETSFSAAGSNADARMTALLRPPVSGPGAAGEATVGKESPGLLSVTAVGD